LFTGISVEWPLQTGVILDDQIYDGVWLHSIERVSLLGCLVNVCVIGTTR
jgi:hypothetical protein